MKRFGEEPVLVKHIDRWEIWKKKIMDDVHTGTVNGYK